MCALKLSLVLTFPVCDPSTLAWFSRKISRHERKFIRSLLILPRRYEISIYFLILYMTSTAVNASRAAVSDNCFIQAVLYQQIVLAQPHHVETT